MDSRGASPVVGTLLMVAVVVVLAAVVGAYTFDAAEEVQNPPPQVAFSTDWEESSRTLTIRHEAGDAFEASNTVRLTVEIRDADETGPNDYLVAETDWVNRSNGRFPVEPTDEFVVTGEDGSGDLDVERQGTNVENTASETHEPEVNDDVRIVWHGTEGRSFVLWEYEITSGEDP
jgi:flagellin-like protein